MAVMPPREAPRERGRRLVGAKTRRPVPRRLMRAAPCSTPRLCDGEARPCWHQPPCRRRRVASKGPRWASTPCRHVHRAAGAQRWYRRRK
eukprot:1529210-Prymnesium_polylepis.1